MKSSVGISQHLEEVEVAIDVPILHKPLHDAAHSVFVGSIPQAENSVPVSTN